MSGPDAPKIDVTAGSGAGLGADRLGAFFLISPNPYLVLDTRFDIIDANQSYLQVTARRREELMGRHLFEAFPSDSDSISGRQLRSSLERVLRQGRADHLPLIRYDIVGPSGAVEERFWSATHTPLLDARGEVEFILQHTVDVTEVQRLRQLADAVTINKSPLVESDVFRRAQAVQETNTALQGDIARLTTMFEQAPGFMAVLRGPDHVFEFANRSYVDLVGGRSLLGRGVGEALPEVTGQGFVNLLDHVYRSGQPYVGRNVRVTLRREGDATEQERWLDFVYQPLRDGPGPVSGIFVQGHDVTEERRAVLALQETERRFRTVAESAPVMLWMGDAQGRCAYLNRALRDFWGVADGAVDSFDWGATIHPGDSAPFFEALAVSMSAQTPFSGEARFRRADGAFRLLQADAQPRFDADGAFLGMIGVNLDHTDIRAAQDVLLDMNVTLEKEVAARTRELAEREAALRQAQKMEVVGQLTGGIAHDFNNLLQIVVGNLESLQRNLPTTSGRLRRAADNAMNGARRAATLTQRLLAFSRRQPLDPKPLNPNRLVSDMSELLHRTLGEDVSVETVLAAGLWQVDVDANQLESAILNLAVNSRDAMPNGGKLTIETANARLDETYARAHAEVAAGQYVVICVSDTGVGMDRDTLARVFEPFFTTKEVGKGTGLGLSMVYGFVKQSGGHVSVYSEPDHGTTVKIYLPRHLGAESEEDERLDLAVPEGTHEETILVLEDDDDVRAYSVEILRELGYRVIEAHDGPSAMRLLERQSHVDLLFTDVILPGGDTGADIARAARALRPDIKVLFTTGYARDAIVHHGRLAEGVELITKPFSYGDLARKIRDVIDDPRSAAGLDGN